MKAAAPTGRNPFTRLRAVVGVVTVYALALIAWIVAERRWPGGDWFGVHVFTLGILTNLVLALSNHFSRTLAHARDVSPRWQVAITNAGIVALLWGIPARNDWAIGVGATLLVVEVMRSYLALRRLRTRSLDGRWTWILRIYERAHGAFVHGAILGALMGTTILHGSWWFSARVAHLHVNILGWAGLTLLATVVFFGPTMLRTRILPGADRRAAQAVRRAANGLMLAVLCLFATGAGGTFATAARFAAAGGLLVYGWAVIEVGLPVIRVAGRAQPSVVRLALPTALSWFVVVIALDVLVVAADAWQYLDALGVAMLAGVLLQVIAVSLAYLAPLLLGADARVRTQLSARINRFATPRTVAWNGGVAGAALSAGLGARAGELGPLLARTGWGLILAATLWLIAAIALPTIESRLHAHRR